VALLLTFVGLVQSFNKRDKGQLRYFVTQIRV